MNDSNLKEHLALHLEEYKTLSQEIQQRVGRQEQLINLSIAVTGLVSTTFSLVRQEASARFVFLALPIIYCAIIWLVIRHDVMIFYAANYIFTRLRPKINELLGLTEPDSIWLWERYRYEKHRSKLGASIFYRFLAFIRYAIPFLLSIASIIIYARVVIVKKIPVNIEDITLIAVDSFVIIFTFGMMSYWVTQPLNFTQVSIDIEP